MAGSSLVINRLTFLQTYSDYFMSLRLLLLSEIMLLHLLLLLIFSAWVANQALLSVHPLALLLIHLEQVKYWHYDESILQVN